MGRKLAFWVLVGILIGTSIFPWISIPIMGGITAVVAIYILFHDVIIPKVFHHKHRHEHPHWEEP